MVDFAAIRAQNIASNKAMLISMGLEQPIIPPSKPNNASKLPKKRKIDASDTNAPVKPAKVSKVASETRVKEEPPVSSPLGGRRSLRNAAKPRISYDETHGAIGVDKAPRLASEVAIMDARRENVGNKLGKRLHDPKSFGDIPGIKVGAWWETRAECSTDAIHAPFVAGIAGSAVDGAYSVALSGGYDDDVDLGYAFTYTGSGGRDLKGTKANPKNLRTAPQSCDQTFDNPMNAALKRSVETKKPVRVIRGFKLRSSYAPESGYRYDGLYTVEKAWLERGLNEAGYKVCKYAFKRIPGQPPLLVSNGESDDGESEEADSAEEVSASEDET